VHNLRRGSAFRDRPHVLVRLLLPLNLLPKTLDLVDDLFRRQPGRLGDRIPLFGAGEGVVGRADECDTSSLVKWIPFTVWLDRGWLPRTPDFEQRRNPAIDGLRGIQIPIRKGSRALQRIDAGIPLPGGEM
jgi:hypothetical protein